MSEAAKTTLQKVSDAFQDELLADLQDGLSQSHERVDAISRETNGAVSKILETSARQAESLKRQLIGSAELESRNGQLTALEAEVNRVFNEAMRLLSSLSPSSYESAVTRLVEEGIQVIGKKATVSCNERDKKLLGSVTKKLSKGEVKLTLGRADVNTIGGIVMSSPDGTVSFDNTFEARLERTRQDLRKEVAGVLTSRVPGAPGS
jgi:V/A-type H+-transporting ATPase subunit E